MKIKTSEHRFVEENRLTKYFQSMCQQREDTGHFCYAHESHQVANHVVAVKKRCPTNSGFDLATPKLKIQQQEYKIKVENLIRDIVKLALLLLSRSSDPLRRTTKKVSSISSAMNMIRTAYKT
jgi:hypothetical protein